MINTLISDALKKELEERLNTQLLLRNPRTGTVQSQKLWETETTESFVQSELYPVKLVNEQWVKVQ